MHTWRFAILFVCACGSKSNSGDNEPDASRACSVDDDCPPGSFCSANGTCIPDGNCKLDEDCGPLMVCNPSGTCEPGGCGGEALDLTYVPPNFIVVLDRSCSMRTNLAGTMTSKWSAAVAALNNVLTSYATDVRWGLTLFPDTTGNNCTQDANAIPIADNTAPTISTLLTNALVTTDALYPDGPCVTNIDTGIQQASTDPALADPTRERFVMLVSDGAQAGCSDAGGDAGTEAMIADLYTNRDITTFVVGFGSAADAAQLNKFAVAGGAPLPGATKYYQADTAAQIAQVFQTIVGMAVSCEYLVDPPPPDSDDLYVYYNNTELVPRDPSHAMGWDYDPATMKITIYGSYCDRLKSHAVTDVDVIFGCPIN